MTSSDTTSPHSFVPRIIGRSSSHFTRLVRLFAHECGVRYELQVVPDLLATEPAAFGGNPGLKLPNLVTPDGVIFGSLNSCRAVAQMGVNGVNIAWPEQVRSLLAGNAQELTLQAMTTEVALILATAKGAPATAYSTKLRAALVGTMDWLESNVVRAIGELPLRDISYFEAALFSLIGHLEFRAVLPMADYPQLRAFATEWGQRQAAVATPFGFD